MFLVKKLYARRIEDFNFNWWLNRTPPTLGKGWKYLVRNLPSATVFFCACIWLSRIWLVESIGSLVFVSPITSQFSSGKPLSRIQNPLQGGTESSCQEKTHKKAGQGLQKHTWKTLRLWATLRGLFRCLSLRTIFHRSTLFGAELQQRSSVRNFLHLHTGSVELMSSLARELPLSPKTLLYDNDGDRWSLWNNKGRFFLCMSVCRCSSVPEFLDLIFLWSALRLARLHSDRTDSLCLKSQIHAVEFNTDLLSWRWRAISKAGPKKGTAPEWSTGGWKQSGNTCCLCEFCFIFIFKNLGLWVWAVLVRYLL